VIDESGLNKDPHACVAPSTPARAIERAIARSIARATRADDDVPHTRARDENEDDVSHDAYLLPRVRAPNASETARARRSLVRRDARESERESERETRDPYRAYLADRVIED